MADIIESCGAMEFIAIDFETANPSYASICQIGFARYSASELVDEWRSYVDPEEHFHPMNVRIHWIDFPVVQDAPRLSDLHSGIMTHSRMRRRPVRF